MTRERSLKAMTWAINSRRHLPLLLLAVFFVWLVHSSNTTSSAQAPSTLNPPVGTIVAWVGQRSTIPPNWKMCNGEELDRNQFPLLFNAIGTVWGGTATNKFKLPDLQGYFLRGVDGGTGRDPDVTLRTSTGTAPLNDVGSTQPDAYRAHTHQINDPGHRHDLPWNNFLSAQEGEFERSNGQGGPPIPKTSTATTGIIILNTGTPAPGNETRPKNAYVYWIIRVK